MYMYLHLLVRPMQFEFIDRLVVVMSVAETGKVLWGGPASPASVHLRYFDF